MARLDELPADQRAVLGLLLKQGRTYSQIAGVLRLEDRAVRERALDALDALGPQDDALTAEDQDLVADYLLGQADGPAREEAQALLAESRPAREFAHVVADELEGFAPAGTMPELPGDDDVEEEPEPAPAAVPAAAAAAPAPAAAGDDEPAEASAPAAAPAAGELSSRSRTLGTGLIIGAAVVAVIGIIITLSGGFGGGDDSPATADAPVATTRATTPATGASTTGTSTAAARVDQQVELSPVNRGSSALGVAQLSSQGGQRAIAVVAQDLSPGYYAIWLANSDTDVRFLGFGSPVSNSGQNAGSFGARGPLPAGTQVANYRQVLVSRQQVTQQNFRTVPSRPGTIVLRGQLR